MNFEKRKVLVVSPHPDDDILACGGVILEFLSNDATVKVVYYSMESPEREEEAVKALAELGVGSRDIYFCDPPSQVSDLADVILPFNPEVVFMPHATDGHDDHQTVHYLVYSILKHVSLDYIPEVWMYGVWNPVVFPHFTFDVTRSFGQKVSALSYHISQSLDFDLIGLCEAVNHLYYLRDLGGKERYGYAESFVRLII